MNKITWIVESKGNSNLPRFQESVEKLGLNLQKYEYIPFSDDIILCDGICFVYGSINLRNKALASNLNMKGICTRLFSIEEMNKKYGEDSLNYRSKIITVKEFLESNANREDIVFIRPDLDSKTLNGSVDTWRHHQDNISVSLNRIGGLNLEDKLVIAEPINILEEYRCFIVDGKVVSCSQYMKNRKLFVQSENISDEIIKFASKLASQYSPEPAFVLDIGILENGELKAIEFNSINCSGLYDCDASEIIMGLYNYFILSIKSSNSRD